MIERITRAFPTEDLEVRAAQRTVTGIAVPWDQVADVFDTRRGPYQEAFVRGAFTRTIRERGDRVKFLANHADRQFPLGRATVLREDPGGLYAEFHVSKTRDGDEALELIRDGALDSLSIGFSPISEDTRSKPGVVLRTEVALREVSVVSYGAYEGARILALRSATGARPALSLARRRLALIEAAAGSHLPKD